MSSDDNPINGFQEKPSRETLVDKLTKEIELNLNNEQFGVDSLAQAMGMSRSSLHRKLNKLQGISTSQFIREYRLKRAHEILTLEDITASEAAYRVGFSSATYFSTCFHKFYEYTPGEAKSRTTIEIGESNELDSLKNERDLGSKVAKSKSKKSSFNNITVLATLLISVSIAAFYFYRASADESVQTDGNNVTNEKSIVVIPFKNWTGNPDLEYISDGMTDAVTSRLTKVNAIEKVIPFTSALQYKMTEKPINEIVNELGVANVLQGNLQISGNQIKVNLQLIHGSSNVHLWSEEYMREWKSDEIFKIQAEVVEAVARNMQATISENELVAIQNVPTENKQAYSYFLQAEFQRNKANESAYNHAIELYQKSIEIDSNFVEAYASEARVWSFGGLVWGIFDERVAWQNAKRLLEKALEIDPDNKAVEEELYSGHYFYDWNFELVESYYQKMLNDFYFDDTPSINADYAIKTGRYQEAVIAMDELILRNPAYGPAFCFKAEALMFLGRTDEAIDILINTNSLYDDNWFYLRESARHYFYLGEYERSKNQLHILLNRFSDYPPILMWFNATFAQMEGNSEKASTHLTELYKSYYDSSSGSPAWFIAMYYTYIQDYNKTFEWLQNSFDRHEVEMTWLREEPLLAPIRTDSRYKKLYEQVGFSSIGIPIKTSAEN